MAALLRLTKRSRLILRQNTNGYCVKKLWEDVHANYETEKERIQLSNYQRYLQLRKVK